MPDQCRTRGCTRRPDPESYYGRCTTHMWCRWCGCNEVESGNRCPTCREYTRTHGGRQRPLDLVELQRRRMIDQPEEQP